MLEGPQGTLFGGGALSGVLRYITNKPKLDVTEADVDAGYGITAHGDPNTNATAVLNLPLIADTLAVRGVIYDDHHGGYINNVPSTFTPVVERPGHRRIQRRRRSHQQPDRSTTRTSSATRSIR